MTSSPGSTRRCMLLGTLSLHAVLIATNPSGSNGTYLTVTNRGDHPAMSHKFGELLEWVQAEADATGLTVNPRRSHLRYSDILELKDGPNGLGLVSKQRFERGDTVAQLPLSSIVTEYNYKGASEGGTWSDDLAFYLIQQKRAGAVSPLAPYLSVLPAYTGRDGIESNRAKFWEPGLLQQYLRGSNFPDFVANQANSVRADYLRLNANNIPWEEYDWAKDIIATRAMRPPDSSFRLPLLFSVFDLALHGDAENIHVTIKGEHLCVVAVRQILPGHDILNTYVDYGFTTSWNTVEGYGFTTPKISSRRKQVVLRVGAASAMKHASAIAPDSWQNNDAGGLVVQEFTLLDTTQNSKGALAFIGYLRFLADPNDYKAFDRKYINTFTPARPANWDVEAAAFKIGLQLVTESLNLYPNSLEADRELLDKHGFTTRAMFLVSIRYDEKLTLHWWLRLFQRGLRARSAFSRPSSSSSDGLSVEEYWEPRALTHISMAEADTREQLSIIVAQLEHHVRYEYECALETPLEFGLGFFLAFLVADLFFRGVDLEPILITLSPAGSTRAMLAKRLLQCAMLLMFCAIGNTVFGTHATRLLSGIVSPLTAASNPVNEWQREDADWRSFDTKLKLVIMNCAIVLGIGALGLHALLRAMLVLCGVESSPRPATEVQWHRRMQKKQKGAPNKQM